MTLTIERQKVISHPTKAGFWTIVCNGQIYGEYASKELAVAVMLAAIEIGRGRNRNAIA